MGPSLPVYVPLPVEFQGPGDVLARRVVGESGVAAGEVGDTRRCGGGRGRRRSAEWRVVKSRGLGVVTWIVVVFCDGLRQGRVEWWREVVVVRPPWL